MAYSKDFYISLLTCMLKIRICEESLVDPILQGEIKCPCHLYSGQEAIAAGVCSNLTKDDVVFGTHRSHGHYLAKGGDLNALIAEIYCKDKGCARGRGGSMHLIQPEIGFMGAAPIVAGTISLALGAGLAFHIQDKNNVAVASFGDGAAGEGVLYEAINFAAIHKLPVIFVCENNFYSTHMPIHEIRNSNVIFDTAGPFKVKSYREDGNDVIAVHESTRMAVEACRKGDGPVFLEFTTYRLRGHVGPDDNIQGCHTDIRPPEEIEAWRKKDPIKRFKKFLLDSKIISLEEIKTIEDEIKCEVEEAHVAARSANYPNPKEIAYYVFK